MPYATVILKPPSQNSHSSDWGLIRLLTLLVHRMKTCRSHMQETDPGMQGLPAQAKTGGGEIGHRLSHT